MRDQRELIKRLRELHDELWGEKTMIRSSLLLCVHSESKTLHIADPLGRNWVCDSRRKCVPKQSIRVSIREFMDILIELIREQRRLALPALVWDVLEQRKRQRTLEAVLARLYRQSLEELYAVEGVDLPDVDLCDKCLGFFLGAFLSIPPMG